ncbi:aldehyde dehydrogenase family protein [Streptomyces sp. NPDC088747]|uniref:aldehyde dehydrogenase family protein n=1 Tax=Streptomyces sp. NPDC088747 TaxID=3365886 RepID=UPI003820E826
MSPVGRAAPAVRVPLLIGGKPTEGRGTFEVRDPGRFTDVVALVEEAGPEHVDAAVRAAAGAAADWRDRSVAERVALLGAAVSAVESAIGELSPLLTRENGGTLVESRMDLTRGAALFRDLLGLAPQFLAPRTTETATHRLSVERVPVGVVALIVPWNSPIVLTLSKLAPALVSGNTAVVKPSVLAPVTLTEVLRTIADGLPPGVLNVVHGDAEAGSTLVAHPSVRKVSFTGSVPVGRQIMADAAGGVKRVSLELGGNDAAVVLDDADFAAAVPALAKGAFTRAGQICFAVKRVYVPAGRIDAFHEQMCAEVDGYRVGHGTDERTTFGPLISARERDRVRGLVRRAREAGAEVRELGRPTDSVDWEGGNYLLPTVVSGLDPRAELVTVEQFGPVLPLVPYQDEDEAVALANDSEYGLASSVWSTDTDRALRVARRIEAGATFVNSHNLWSLSFDMPFGGVKQSGLGRERTALGLQEYVEEHAIRLTK